VWYYYVGIFHDGIDYLRPGFTMVEDLTGFGWKHFDMDLQKQLSSIWIDTFPIRIKRVLVLHPPKIMGAVLKLLKTIMKLKLFDRVEILDKPVDLQKWINEDQLASSFGGSVPFDQPMWIKELRDWAEKNEERLIAPGRE